MMKKFALILLGFVLMVSGMSQTKYFPDIPVIKGYKGKEGKIVKYHYFNFLSLTDKSGDNKRQSTGQYWEVSYVYDSAFRQKQKFAEFIVKQINDKGGSVFFQDTTAIHFAIPDTDGHLWGKVMLTKNTLYKLKLIKERAFQIDVLMDTIQELVYDDFVQPVEIPPRVGFLPNSVVTRAEQSKFNHYSFTYNTDKLTYRQKLMGPYWDIKLEIQDEAGKVDKRYSYIQIQENYYRAVLKAGGKIIKNRAREIIFNLPGDEFTVWVRLMVNMDGVYFIRVVKQYPEDYQDPEQLYSEQGRDTIPNQDK